MTRLVRKQGTTPRHLVLLALLGGCTLAFLRHEQATFRALGYTTTSPPRLDDDDNTAPSLDTTTAFVLSELFPETMQDTADLELFAMEEGADDNSASGTMEEKREVDNSEERGDTEAATDATQDIRRWGCGLTQTPLIFVHIGKAGGGSVRARFAAAALHYNRTNWRSSNDTTAYYAIPPRAARDEEEGRGYFCQSGHPSYRLQDRKTFEGTLRCDAVTPLGQAIACPGPLEVGHKCHGCAPEQATCHRVYMGHNQLGTELHWLPSRYLAAWWKTMSVVHASGTEQGLALHSRLESLWPLLQVNNSDWCTELQRSRPRSRKEMYRHYDNCTKPLAQLVDTYAQQWMQHRHGEDTGGAISSNTERDEAHVLLSSTLGVDPSLNWGTLYSSLPVLRTTVVREPFSWLLSKFFWHGHAKLHKCGNLTAAGHREFHLDQLDKASEPGWAHRTARFFVMQICGEDCQSRWDMATTKLGARFTTRHEDVLLASFERQADYNLRHSFAVVGRVDESSGFYNMVSARVHYLNMSRNLHVTGGRHSSRPSPECQEVYTSPAFQAQLEAASPAVASLIRLYKTALRVNAFQKEELRSCAAPPALST
jgi:hypothetical protein